MSEPVIRLDKLTKEFGGLRALDELSLDLMPGDVFGFIGPNGAGKSTTMKIVSGLLKPTSGEAFVLGKAVQHHGDFVRRNVGYMPDTFGVYDDLTVTEYLDFFAAAYGLNRITRRRKVGEVLDLTELRYKENAMVDSLSRGMQQRLGLARVLVHDPPILLLDEPASGLDPRARIEIRELILNLQRLGKTIVVSSHILSELGEFCNKLGIVERGRLVVFGTIDDLSQKASQKVVVVIRSPDAERAEQLLKSDARIALVERNGNELRVELNDPTLHQQFVIESLVNAGVRIDAIAPHQLTLEEVFLRLTQGLVA
ncbi:MAG TPA: ABC transporter ATP-binding protein [Tepidisphaeraceae bacterium]|nr:ABC transporter ATP-binding protein [Tepidisphaeraceae bacterium]